MEGDQLWLVKGNVNIHINESTLYNKYSKVLYNYMNIYMKYVNVYIKYLINIDCTICHETGNMFSGSIQDGSAGCVLYNILPKMAVLGVYSITYYLR